jgi:heavy metal translocating P-type ATPase
MTRLPRAALLAAAALAGLLLAGYARFGAQRPDRASFILLVTLVAAGLPLVLRTGLGLLRGRFAADVVAALAIVGAAILGQYFAGAIIVLMQAGGEALEAYAMRRASHSIEALLARAPRIARRRRAGRIEDIPVEAVAVGDMLVMRPGDMVPVDCTVTEGHSAVDQSALTGEPLPLSARPGVELLSGSVNLHGALTVRALRLAGDSQYQQVVLLVEAARADKAPIQRLADRFAVWFTPLTLAMCAVAWLVDREWVSVLSVLVVATPCPLILATPVAVIAGIGRAARRGIIIRHGAAIEDVGLARAVVFDKTGTLTLGAPVVRDVQSTSTLPPDDVLRLAAAAEQLSSHHLGQAITRAGVERFGSLPEAADLRETAGAGIEARVEGRAIAVGADDWLGRDAAAPRTEPATGPSAGVQVDGVRVGRILFEDRLRPEIPALMQSLRALGLRHIVMLSGDHQGAAEAIAREAGITEVHGGLLPAQKVERLADLRRRYGRVIMVGDGINDAPALAAANVGIAMGAHAPAAAAQAADVVLLVDDAGRVGETIVIGRRTRRIALQSIGVGLGVSFALMVVAAFGHMAPALGALAQEALDVAVILNALRARA